MHSPKESPVKARRPTLRLPGQAPPLPPSAPEPVTVPEPAEPAPKPDKAAAEARARQQRTEAEERRIATRQANLARLVEMFPVVFDPDAPRPLAIGCNRQLRAALAIPWSQVDAVLWWWTRRPEYHAAVAAGGPRYNLDGTEAGVVAEEHRAMARRQI
jgi:RNA chaperone ProQ/FINO-like protein